MADSLHQRLLSEQRFTADVAQELRTPLVGLLTASELLLAGGGIRATRPLPSRHGRTGNALGLRGFGHLWPDRVVVGRVG